MKTIIIRWQRPGQKLLNPERFAPMLSALNQIGISGEFCPIRSKRQLINTLNEKQPDIVFSTDYYTINNLNEKVNIHQLLDVIHMPYIGSSPESLELVLAKSSIKEKWQNNQVSTPSFLTLNKSDFLNDPVESIKVLQHFPYIIKPNLEGNSRGLDESSIIFNQEALLNKLSALFQVYGELLVEKYITDAEHIREFTIALIGNQQNKILMPAEIRLKKKKKHRIITTDDKDNHNTTATPVSDPALLQKLENFSTKAFDVAKIRDYSRCDIMMQGEKLYAIEINGQPMIPDKWFKKCASGKGLNATQYIQAIYLAGIMRNFKGRRQPINILTQIKKRLPAMTYSQLTK